MARQKKPEKDNAERWLLTYADLMNLLLILFIILYSMSQVDQKKYEAVASGMKESFHNKDAENQNEADPQGVQPREYWIRDDLEVSAPAEMPEDTQKTQYEKELLKIVEDKNLEANIEISVDNRGVVITIKDAFLYNPGSATIARDVSEIVVQMGQVLNKIPYRQIIIEGHTDSDPLNRQSIYVDNLGLSSARAVNVSRLLIKAGLDPSLISAMGYGEFRPVAPNDTPEHKSKNRRVLITLLRKNVGTVQTAAAQ